MAKGQHGGRRDNAGRRTGSRNKATLEREQRALDELRGKAARLAPQVWAKDKLEDLIPEAEELTKSIKGVVAKLQSMIFDQLNGADAKTAAAAATSSLMRELRDWTGLLKDAQVASSLIMSRAGDFQSPKLQRIAVGVGLMPGMGGLSLPGPAEPPKKGDNVITIDDPASLARVYARMVQEAA